MKASVIGLGLIGASLAKMLKSRGYKAYGWDISPEICDRAVEDGVIEGLAQNESLSECGLIFIALYPGDTLDYLRVNAGRIRRGAVVIDCGGVKRAVCAQAEEIARGHGFLFIGGHPMAGREKSGYAASSDDLFEGASMLLTPPEGIEPDILNRLRALFSSLGFGRVVFTTPQEHDRIIAYTSQLAHVVSSSYIKSPTAFEQAGFSAGSFKDMTRVAFLNESMWTELFMDNRDNLIREIEILQEHLEEYKRALADNDREKLLLLLREGRLCKEKADSLN